MLELGVEIFERYTGGPVDPEHLRGQAAKRVGLQFVVREAASWDHRKLAGCVLGERVEHAQERRDHVGVELRAGAAHQLGARLGLGQARRYGRSAVIAS